MLNMISWIFQIMMNSQLLRLCDMLQPKVRFFPLVFLANAIATSGSTTFEQHTQGDGFHTNSCSSIGTHQVDLQYVYSLEPKWKTDS